MAALLSRLTVERAAIVIAHLLLFAMASRVAIDPDMWWQLRLGQQIAETGEFVSADRFSHTRTGQSRLNHSGFAQVLMYACWRLGGHLGMTLFTALLAVSALHCVFRAGRGSIYMQSYVLVLGAACAAAFWSPRPQMFTFLGAAITLYMIRRLQRRSDTPLWPLPLLMWAWANLHGGYVIGYLFIGGFVLGEGLKRRFGMGDGGLATPALRRLCAYSLLSLLLLPINPLGLSIYAAPLDTLAIPGLRSAIQEWQPPDFSGPGAWSFVGLLALLLASALASRRRVDLSAAILAGGTLVMALYSARHVSLFAITAIPMITTQLDAFLARRGWRMRHRNVETPGRVALNLALIGVVAFGALAQIRHVASAATVERALALNYPLGALRYLQAATAPGHLFNSYKWGGYLIFHAPDLPVFIDGRTDLYRDLLSDYVAAATGGPEWRAVFARHEIGSALIERESPLAAQLEAADEWRLEYQDAVASVFLRSPSTSEGGGL
ncbi:MAG: hypothetical protein F4X02_02105 [Chloroflexi bacterium]|nr:hypothetical protein [Chloroflexota bacterium]